MNNAIIGTFITQPMTDPDTPNNLIADQPFEKSFLDIQNYDDMQDVRKKKKNVFDYI